MRILLVSFHFPPYNIIGAVTVGKTAKYLTQLGHEVRVLTADRQPYPQTLPVEIPPERITYTPWRNLGASSLARRVFGPSDGHDTLARRLKAALRHGLRAIYRASYRGLLFPDHRVGWYPYAVRAGDKLIREWRPDLIYCSAGPVTPVYVARTLARRHHLPWVAEFRDAWLENPAYRRTFPWWRRPIDRFAERNLLSEATGLTTTSEVVTADFERKYRRPTLTVYGGYDPEDFPTQPAYPNGYDHLRIVYTGAIYEAGQDPSPVLEAFRLLGAEAEGLRLACYGYNLQSMPPLVQRHGVGHLVELHEAVPYRESVRLQHEADLLLLLLWTDPNYRGVYPGKVFEYLGARRPILAVGPCRNQVGELLVKRGVGVYASQPEEIAAYLRAQLAIRRREGQIPFQPTGSCDDLRRENQVRRLAEFLQERALAGGRELVGAGRAGQLAPEVTERGVAADIDPAQGQGVGGGAVGS
ncbi:MAG TPA: glycosyltransferase [Armatimonadota bacterium]|jgi:glycosyltransferase involved in cell wall biosynthesis